MGTWPGTRLHDEGTIRRPSRDGLKAKNFLSLFWWAWSPREPQPKPCGCHPWLPADTASSSMPCGVWTRSHSDVRAAVQGEGCRGWVYSPPQPLLCLEVEHKCHVLSGCPICSALPKDMPRKPRKTTVHVLIPSLSFLSFYFTPFHPCWKLCSPPCHRSTA